MLASLANVPEVTEIWRKSELVLRDTGFAEAKGYALLDWPEVVLRSFELNGCF